VFKLVSLRASGFKRLDIEDKLEFPDGRILVHGRNESGKSTLMEAIHYALYGQALRPSKNAGNDDIICYGRDQAVVELEFSIEDDKYQVRRDLYKKKTNYHILNKREPSGELTRVATGARKVNEEISEILHGIDSDALLNSCLVEQKELGKLEASSKQERIKAMSSLLNLEAFIDSKDTLKKEASDLEKIHLQTINKLAEAEKAKQEYETAEKQLKQAEKRLEEIETERETVQNRLEQLQRDLAVIQQMKTHQNKINETKNSLKAKSNELELLREQLAEIEKAEKELEKTSEQIPEAEKQVQELEKQLETVQKLSDLQEQLRETESSIENINLRYNETQRAHIEASEAQTRIKELETQIKEYTPARNASEKLSELSNLFNKLSASNTEINRLNTELETIKERLGETRDSQETLNQFEKQETEAKQRRAQAEKMRTYGFAASITGLILALALAYFVNLTAGIAIGLIGVATGGYLFLSNNPRETDTELDRIRKQRESLLGEQARLQDYHKSIENLETQLNQTQETHSKTQETIIELLNQLPDQPREYKTTVNLTEPETLDTLRAQIQEDTETLTRLTTEKNSLQKKADTQEALNKILESIKQEKETKTSEEEQLTKQITETEQETGIKREQETEIRNKHNEANKKLTQLTTQQTNYQQALERRPQVTENITEATNDINLLKAAQQQEEEQLTELEKQGVSLGDEPSLNEERDQNLKTSASLEKETQERNNDITESREIIEKTSELRDQYPDLAEESERETFRIEAMRRATILLDTTRESIMAGVKQNVEKNMMQFLPTLTDNRYNRAQIDEANYRIEVYDREAKTWRGKGVFSGATQDQFSLALRLAFAISTIPSSRGARPGFIFLDEPLSGFDAQRRTGFIQLLREDLSKHFDQIIVISHIEALAEEFPQNLTLDSGRIVQQ